MRPRERRETSERDLFRSRLDQIIDMKHALVKLGRAIDWGFLEQTFGAVCSRTPRFLASRVSPLIAACKSFASVGKVMSLGCGRSNSSTLVSPP